MPANVVSAAKDLWQGARSLTPSDIGLAESALSSQQPKEVIAGCIILTISKSNRVATDVISNHLSELCTQIAENASEDLFWLLSAVVMLPEGVVSAHPRLRMFVYRCIFSENTSCRVNTTLMLARLAKQGDSTAAGLLKLAESDGDFRVAANARTSLPT